MSDRCQISGRCRIGACCEVGVAFALRVHVCEWKVCGDGSVVGYDGVAVMREKLPLHEEKCLSDRCQIGCQMVSDGCQIGGRWRASLTSSSFSPRMLPDRSTTTTTSTGALWSGEGSGLDSWLDDCWLGLVEIGLSPAPAGARRVTPVRKSLGVLPHGAAGRIAAVLRSRQ